MSHLEEVMALHLRCAQVEPWEREHRFHPTRRWRFDFAWPTKKIALEVEGGTWTGGAHVRGAHFESDCIKYGEAAILGWRVIRVPNTMVQDGRALDLIERVLHD